MDIVNPAERRTTSAGKPAPSALRYLARQPILDVQGKAHGYELLFREGPDGGFRGDAEAATRIMIDNAIVFGLRKLTGGTPAFVNCTADALVQNHVRILPPGMAVLELPSDIDVTSELESACRHLKASGYKLALDRFSYAPALKSLIKLVDYIKIDWLTTNPRERMVSLEVVRSAGKSLVAERIETYADFESAQNEGFALF
jgi:EAL and modified HD-GYP domain-containing signal transduction protein